MDFAFTAEHDELRDAVRRFLDRESPEARVRALMETERGFDERTWRRAADEMALPGLVVAESHGGAGLGPVELAIVLEEMGRALFCGPFLSTAVLAAQALALAADEAARSRHLPGIARGETVAAVVFGDGVRARPEGEAWSLEGSASPVVDGHAADLLLVFADGGLFAVEGGASGLERTALPVLDLTRKLARVAFSGTRAARLSPADASAARERVLALGAVALAAEQVGGAQRCLELSTEHARTRLQFGRPIGSYQAIKHRCADMLVEVELARSAAYHAAFRAAEGGEVELLEAAHAAKSATSEAFFRAAADTIQIHGGMGFTWEHPAHLYFKRAKASSVLLGDPLAHREALARRLGL